MKEELVKIIKKLDLDYDELCELRNEIDKEVNKKRPESFNDLVGIEELNIDPYVIGDLIKDGVYTLGDVFRKYKNKSLEGLGGRVREEVEFILRTYDMDKYKEKPVNLDRNRK